MVNFDFKDIFRNFKHPSSVQISDTTGKKKSSNKIFKVSIRNANNHKYCKQDRDQMNTK